MSVVVPALNEAVLLPVLLDALAAQTSPPDEVIVADGGSHDDTVSLARRAGALDPRHGPGHGRLQIDRGRGL